MATAATTSTAATTTATVFDQNETVEQRHARLRAQYQKAVEDLNARNEASFKALINKIVTEFEQVAAQPVISRKERVAGVRTHHTRIDPHHGYDGYDLYKAWGRVSLWQEKIVNAIAALGYQATVVERNLKCECCDKKNHTCYYYIVSISIPLSVLLRGNGDTDNNGNMGGGAACVSP